MLAIQAYMRLKLMTGMAHGDLLRLTVLNLQEDGIHIQRHKTAGTTGKRTIYEWTPELRAAMELAKSVRPALSPFLFANRKGKLHRRDHRGGTRLGLDVAALHGPRACRDEGEGAVHRTRPAREVRVRRRVARSCPSAAVACGRAHVPATPPCAPPRSRTTHSTVCRIAIARAPANSTGEEKRASSCEANPLF